MTLEALVYEVEAMDPIVLVDALLLLCIENWSIGPFSIPLVSSSHRGWFDFRLPLIQNLHTKYVMIAIATMPPITPPTIGPTGELEFVGVAELEAGSSVVFLMQEVEPQLVHVVA